jgi:hypothetical protein
LLCFSHGRSLWYWDYGGTYPDIIYPIDDKPHSDIDALLDSVARNSPLLNMPEKYPDHWVVYRADLSHEEIEILNKYRLRFGLPKI